MIKISTKNVITKFEQGGINTAPYIKFLLELSEDFSEKDKKIRQEIAEFLQPYQTKLAELLLDKYGSEGIDLIAFDHMKSVEDFYLESLIEGKKSSCSFSIFECGGLAVLSNFVASQFYAKIIEDLTEEQKKSKLFKPDYKELWKAQKIEHVKLYKLWCDLLTKFFDA